MTRSSNPRSSFRQPVLMTAVVLALTLAAHLPSYAQQIFGTITGTVRDASGGRVPDVTQRRAIPHQSDSYRPFAIHRFLFDFESAGRHV